MNQTLIGWLMAIALIMAIVMAAQTDKGGFPCHEDEVLTFDGHCISYDSIVDSYIDTLEGE